MERSLYRCKFTHYFIVNKHFLYFIIVLRVKETAVPLNHGQGEV